MAQRKTHFVVKDVLVSILMPMLIDPVWLPKYYISNLPFEATSEDVRVAFGRWKLDHVSISARQDGRSKGCGFIRFETRDGLDDFLANRDPNDIPHCQIIMGDRHVVCCEAKSNEER